MRINPSAFNFPRNISPMMGLNTAKSRQAKSPALQLISSTIMENATIKSTAAKLSVAVAAREATRTKNMTAMNANVPGYDAAQNKGIEATWLDSALESAARRQEQEQNTLKFELSAKLTYTKEDAIDRMSRGIIKLDGTPQPDRAETLANGISNEVDLSMTSLDLTLASGAGRDKIAQAVDYFASRYVAVKERITREFSGVEQQSQLEENLGKLQDIMDAQTDLLARRYMETVGAALEKNGVSGESDRLHNSIIAAVEERIAQYADFAKANPNYADINGAEEERFRKDSAYMASELRIAMRGADVPPPDSSDSDLYSIEDLDKLQAFVKELDNCYADNYDDPNRIQDGSESEESLGMKLGALALKGEALKAHSGISDRMKDTVTRVTNGFIANTIEAQQTYMDKWPDEVQESYERAAAEGRMTRSAANQAIAAINRESVRFDGGAVHDVIDEITTSYSRSGDATKAILDGTSYAMKRFTDKFESNAYKQVKRYDSAHYWDNFMQPKRKTDGTGYSNGYKQGALDGIISAWNNFVGKVCDDAPQISKPQFNAWA